MPRRRSPSKDTMQSILTGAPEILPRSRLFKVPKLRSVKVERLAEAVLKACQDARLEEDPRFHVESVRFLLPYDAIPPAETIKAALREADRTVRPEERGNEIIRARLRNAWDQWLDELSQLEDASQGLPPQTARISLVRIGGGAIVALPGEVFFGIGQRMAARLDAEPVIVAAYCHGYIGYVPDREAFACGGYEVEESHRYVNLWRVSPAAEDIFQKQVDVLWRRSMSQLALLGRPQSGPAGVSFLAHLE